MFHHQAKGIYTKQAHVDIPNGTYEEEHGLEGFFGPVSQLYHSHPPTDWTRIEGPLKPRAYDTTAHITDAFEDEWSVFKGRTTLLYNQDVKLAVYAPAQAAPYWQRNADGDELFFIHAGTGELETDYGPLFYKKGDYLLVPRGVTYRFVPSKKQHHHILVFESSSHFRQPERGMLGHHALYDQTVITTPDPKDYSKGKSTQAEYEVQVKRQGEITRFYYNHHPLDVSGWKGTLYPAQLNIMDICPVGSHRAHLPPSVHTTLLGHGFVICSFVPRPLESAEGAVRVPFYHRNIDFDEVLFYHDGDFFSRDNIKAGMITYHPQGFHHGPHATAMEASWNKTDTDEVAVMLDTRRPLNITPAAAQQEDESYWKSWQQSAAKLTRK